MSRCYLWGRLRAQHVFECRQSARRQAAPKADLLELVQFRIAQKLGVVAVQEPKHARQRLGQQGLQHMCIVPVDERRDWGQHRALGMEKQVGDEVEILGGAFQRNFQLRGGGDGGGDGGGALFGFACDGVCNCVYACVFLCVSVCGGRPREGGR